MKEFEQNDSLIKSEGTDWSIIRDLHIDEGFQYLVNYLTDAVEHLFLSFIAYLTLCSVFYIRSLYCDHCGNFQRRPKRILVVVAHPDDECMFFGPTILKLTSNKKCQVYLLCLSRGKNRGLVGILRGFIITKMFLGNAAGLGKVRKEELWNACSKLGIPSENIVLINSTQLQDNQATEWREDVIAKAILSRVEELQIDTLITFDKQGVSKHKNHCSIFYAVAFLCLDNRVPDCKYHNTVSPFVAVP